jgi:hypothetical protein
LAVLGTLGLVVFFSAAAAGAEVFNEPDAEQVVGVFFSLFVFIPSLVGVALATSTLDRRLTNPATIWVAVIWNALILAVFLLLSVVGLLVG